MTTNILFILASVSKTIPGTALMQLYEKGVFSLKDDINKFPPFKVSNPHHSDIPIIFRMLLNQTSSILDEWKTIVNLYGEGDSDLSLHNLVKGYFVPTMEYYNNTHYSSYEPGEHWEYSNIDFALIGYLFERISKMTFDKYCADNIFKPLTIKRNELVLV